MKVIVGFVLATLVSSGALAQGKQSPELEKFAAEFANAFNKKDASAVAALYKEDAVLMPPDAPIVRGRSNIEGYYKAVLATNPGTLKLSPVGSNVSGNTAFDAGQFTLTAGGSSMTMTGVGGGGKVTAGKYLAVLERVGKDWRIAYDIQNNDQPAPPKK